MKLYELCLSRLRDNALSYQLTMQSFSELYQPSNCCNSDALNSSCKSVYFRLGNLNPISINLTLLLSSPTFLQNVSTSKIVADIIKVISARLYNGLQ